MAYCLHVKTAFLILVFFSFACFQFFFWSRLSFREFIVCVGFVGVI